MKTNKFMFILLFISFYGFSQVRYYDYKGRVIRKIEANSAQSAKQSAVSTGYAYGMTNVTTLLEKSSKTILHPYDVNYNFINYADYQGMCNYYLAPYKRNECNNKLNYIKEAHLKILSLLQLSNTGSINQGIKEQILEKYTSVTNKLFMELEQLKNQVDKETYYRQFLLKLTN
ncbi:hypothetical protein V1387_17965 [Allomuricauda taeanensis]|uniref:hypothetical protein n=1 Tax=Flagellimonas taeanensis TaxID=1005926 RepID=UPI002E7B7D68|nr:hypothetical protein [Allomuricauda taeanensis]MEE1964579.1 hypothetical protein [Allomuricauda taeanensis]